MARRNSGSGVIGFVLLAVIGLAASIPKEVWICIGIVVGLFAIVKLLSSKKSKPVRVEPTLDLSDERASSTATVMPGKPARRAATLAKLSQATGFRIPEPPKGFGSSRWYAPGQTVEIAGRRITGGMLYVGGTLPNALGANDPSLVDPSKKVDSRGDCTIRQTSYYPSYSEIPSSARAAYLDWLVDGRRQISADIGYVFIFFYGLERRVIVDSKSDAAARQEWPAIRAELCRLLAIYGSQSESFKRYAGSLIEWIDLSSLMLTGKLYQRPLVDLIRSYELPTLLRVALGQAAVDKAPVPAHLALSWIKLAPEIHLRSAATRCPDEFDRCFAVTYRNHFGDGVILPQNRALLRLVYRPASAGLREATDIRMDLGNLPDVTAVTTPIQKLREIVEQVTEDLGPYSRYVKRNPGSGQSLEGVLQLPPALWPTGVQNAVEGLKKRVGDGMVVLRCADLLELFRAEAMLTKDQFIALARALEETQIGMEPDILTGNKPPKQEDNVALFSMPTVSKEPRTAAAYKTAVLTLRLASAVASVDGKFNAVELGYLSKQIKAWTHLSPNHQRRLMAQLRLLSKAPVPLQAIKKKFEPLSRAARAKIAAFMTAAAQSGGTVTPAEVRILQKVYTALGVEQDAVYRDIHAAATDAPKIQKKTRSAEFELDQSRIAALKRDTELAATLLGGIFTDEETQDVAPRQPDQEPASSSALLSGLFGLDEAHSAFARLLLGHSEWTRAELSDVAADLELMLDGALERINDACFDAFNLPFTEGEDPITVNLEVLGKIAA